MPRPTIRLVPWDPDSPHHADRLVEQRITCGWHKELVRGPWQEAQRAGVKCIYWMTIPSDDTAYEAKLNNHVTAFPKEKSPLVDTCTSVLKVSRTPTQSSFVPFGHIALDTYATTGVENLDLDFPAESSIWIKTLYVSTALQNSGLGGAAMDTLEEMATSEPLSATTLMLDSVSGEDQLREDFSMEFHGYVPKMANQEWYARRGYRTIKTVQNFYNERHRNGKSFDIKTVFMRRDLEPRP